MKWASHRWTTPAPSSCSASSQPPTNAGPWPLPRTGPSKTGAVSYPNTPPPSASWTGSCTTPPPWSPAESHTGCAKPEPPKEDPRTRAEQPQGVGTFSWPPAGTSTWPLTTCIQLETSYRGLTSLDSTPRPHQGADIRDVRT